MDSSNILVRLGTLIDRHFNVLAGIVVFSVLVTTGYLNKEEVLNIYYATLHALIAACG